MSRGLKLGVSIWLIACATSFGDGLPKSFTLGQYIPDDAWLYMHDVYNPEREFIAKHWARVVQAVGVCGIDDEIKRELTRDMLPPEREEFEGKWRAVDSAVRAVRWTELGKREFVYAQRMIPLIPQHILLFRCAPEESESAWTSLKVLMDALGGLSRRLSVNHDELRGAELVTIRAPLVGNLGAQLFRRDDVIGFATGTRASRVILGMMDGKRRGRSIVDAGEFKTAVASVEEPEDGFGLVRVGVLQEQLRGLFDTLLAGARDDEEVVMFKKVVFKALAHTDFIDHIVFSRRTDGLRESWNTTMKLSPDYDLKPFGRAATRRTKFEAFDQFVPREAKGFSASTFVDLGLIYNSIIKFIRNEIPGEGPEIVKMWEQIQREKLGLDLNRDVFNWLSGEFVVVNLPTMTEAEVNCVAFVRVKDAELARRKVGAAMDWLAENGRSFQIMVSPAPEVEAEGFRGAFHPMLAIMQARPVLGIYEDWLVLGSSPQAVNKCIATSKGLRASIRKNPRFCDEGLPIRGPVNSASFADQSKLGESLAAGCMMAQMFGGMPADNPELAPLKFIFRIASRLGPVFSQLNFFASSATTFSFNGDIGTGHSIVTYKAPAGFALKRGAPD